MALFHLTIDSNPNIVLIDYKRYPEFLKDILYLSVTTMLMKANCPTCF